jgi:hypothetical protein
VKRIDWRGWAVDVGIVAFFAALIAMFCSSGAALTLLAAFAALTIIGTRRGRQ